MERRRRCVIVCLVAGAAVSSAIAQVPDPGAAFEVATIRRNTSGSTSQTWPPANDRFTATNLPVRLLVQMAYNMSKDRVLGGPGWIDTERFDLVAKAAVDSPPAASGRPC